MSLGREGVAYTLGGSAFGDAVKPVEGERRRTRCNRRAAVVTRQPRSNSFIPWCLLKLRINRAGVHSLLLAATELCTTSCIWAANSTAHTRDVLAYSASPAEEQTPNSTARLSTRC